MAEVKTATAKALLDRIEALDYDSYDAARSLLEERGENVAVDGDYWARVLAQIESEAINSGT